MSDYIWFDRSENDSSQHKFSNHFSNRITRAQNNRITNFGFANLNNNKNTNLMVKRSLPNGFSEDLNCNRIKWQHCYICQFVRLFNSYRSTEHKIVFAPKHRTTTKLFNNKKRDPNEKHSLRLKKKQKKKKQKNILSTLEELSAHLLQHFLGSRVFSSSIVLTRIQNDFQSCKCTRECRASNEWNGNLCLPQFLRTQVVVMFVRTPRTCSTNKWVKNTF